MTDVDWDLLFRYRGNECTPEERARFEAWLAANPQHRALVDAAVVAAGRVLDAGPGAHLAGVLGPPRRADDAVPGRGRRRPATRALLAAAACLVVAAAGAVAVRRATAPLHDAATASRTVTTARGERATLRLRDGTRVVLAAASTLRYPADFAAGGAREVTLVGEAYFEVAHDARRPFRVHAGDATAEDLGTAFSVRAYAEDSAVRVVVAEGRVALGTRRGDGAVRGAVLTRGQLGRLARGATVTAVENVDADAYVGWTRGRLAFDDAPLPEALVELGRWYDADFEIDDPSLATHRITATIGGDSLADALALLAPATGLHFERRGRTVVVARPAPGGGGR